MQRSRPSQPSLQRRLLLTLVVVFLLVLGAVALQARYGWADAFAALGTAARHLSHKRLLAVFVGLAGAVWVTVRWRGASRVAYLALLAYGLGVLGDAAILLLLEPLGISHGPVLLPLGILVGLRGALAVSLGLAAAVITPHGAHASIWRTLHLAGQALLLVLVLDAVVIEPMRLTVSYVAVPDPYPVQAAARPLRIVQISDLHLERANSLSRRVVQTVNDLHPDVIALTGDYISASFFDDPQAEEDVRNLVAGLHAEHGIYAILGNMDFGRLRDGSLFKGMPVTYLDGDWATVQVDDRRVAIAGLTMSDDLPADRRALAQLVRDMPTNRFSVLLYHSPDLAPEAAAAGFDLYLAGHTHGGQVRLPLYGAVITRSAYGKRYEMGAYHVGDMLLYVSRGIGMEGWAVPRVRFLCPPEIVCFDIE